VTYESVATYQCQNDESWHGKRFLVVTARGRTKKACGKVALQRTIDVIKDLGDAVNKINGSTDNYTWDVNLGTDTYDGDSEVVGKLDLQTGKRPDEKTKKVEEKKDEKKDTAKKETTEQKQTNTSGGGGTGTTNKKPRKQVAPSTNKTTSQNPNPNSNILPGVIVLGVGVGLGMRHGGDRHGDDHGDFGGR
jgi:sRNA-binding protein